MHTGHLGGADDVPDYAARPGDSGAGAAGDSVRAAVRELARDVDQRLRDVSRLPAQVARYPADAATSLRDSVERLEQWGREVRLPPARRRGASRAALSLGCAHQNWQTVWVRATRVAVWALKLLAVTLMCFFSALVIYAVLYWLVVPEKSHSFAVHFDFSDRRGSWGADVPPVPPGGGALAAVPVVGAAQVAALTYDVNILSARSEWQASELLAVPQLERLLAEGQAYDIWLNLEAPTADTSSNLDAGMFVIRTELFTSPVSGDADTEAADAASTGLLARSARSVLLPQRSWIIDRLRKVLLAPLLVTGILPETSSVEVRLFDSFVEQREHRLERVRLSLSSPDVHIASATLWIDAQMSGPRYLMYHWFVTSFVLGVTYITLALLGGLATVWLMYRAYNGDWDDSGDEEDEDDERYHGGRRWGRLDSGESDSVHRGDANTLYSVPRRRDRQRYYGPPGAFDMVIPGSREDPSLPPERLGLPSAADVIGDALSARRAGKQGRGKGEALPRAEAELKGGEDGESDAKSAGEADTPEGGGGDEGGGRPAPRPPRAMPAELRRRHVRGSPPPTESSSPGSTSGADDLRPHLS